MTLEAPTLTSVTGAGLVPIAQGPAGGTQASGLPDNLFAPDPQQEYQNQQIDTAISNIEKSDYATTEDGKAVLARIKDARAKSKITFVQFANPEQRGAIANDKGIQIKAAYLTDPDEIASELVHEGAHLVFETRYDAVVTTVDDERFALENQIIFYREQKQSGFSDPKLEERLAIYEAGGLTAFVIRRSQEKGNPLEFDDESWALWFRRLMIQQAELWKAGGVAPPLLP